MAKVVQLTRSELNKIKETERLRATDYTIALMIAYLMEEEEVNCSPDRILEILEGVHNYANAIKEHTITLNQVINIIEEHTRLNIMTGEIKDND